MASVRKTGGTVEFVNTGEHESSLSSPDETKLDNAYERAAQRKAKEKLIKTILIVAAAVIVVAFVALQFI
ncbi:MAG: hypothetical protein CL943_02720 [Candidatus Diapherotrites archaeon]|uniref:Uncharacterized protein n=1 Tax=Candidatus Iainarchaeum sp. TaxID=3101447 RepID=A0A2D6M190_9ARCH|nr:hypothetical protein [Candidatus Diapherotrites archaeon]|tara:strand:- start:281 stop:490 length:210 start_codon:yes stop_codon:yes gene_type:complete